MVYVRETNDGLSIQVNGRESLVFSNRSVRRVSQYLSEQIRNAQEKGSVFLWVAPYFEEIGRHLPEPSGSFLWLDPLSEDERLPPNEEVVSLKQFERFLLKTDARARFTIEVYSALRRASGLPDYEALLSNAFRKVASRLKTLAHFQKKWEVNFKHNREKFSSLRPWTELEIPPPGAFVLAGPSVDKHWTDISQKKHIWICDTALVSGLRQGIQPGLIFTIDAGKGTMEHFIGSSPDALRDSLALVDPLVFPKILDLPVRGFYSYQSGNPLISQLDLPPLDNETNDVYGIMESLYGQLYPGAPLPPIYGHEMKHKHYVTHLRESAYHARARLEMNRYKTPELYFYNLSRRYA